MVPDYEAEVARLEEELKLSLVEHDPADENDVIVEVRQGVGGDEAGLWAADVARMLQRYAERRGFKWEELEVNANEGGGLKEGTFAVKGVQCAADAELAVDIGAGVVIVSNHGGRQLD